MDFFQAQRHIIPFPRYGNWTPILNTNREKGSMVLTKYDVTLTTCRSDSTFPS